MSNKVKGLVVTLEGDLHEDYAERIIDAIKTIKGVLDAKAVDVDIHDHINRTRIKYEYKEILLNTLK